jgi:hypothetical protein
MVIPIVASFTSEAYAASSAALESPSGVIETSYAAELMGVSTQQAAADLALQHDAIGYVQALQQSGDDVEYDNADATLRVYGPPSPAAAPTSVTDHIVLESQPFQQTPFTARPPQLVATPRLTSTAVPSRAVSGCPMFPVTARPAPYCQTITVIHIWRLRVTARSMGTAYPTNPLHL